MKKSRKFISLLLVSILISTFIIGCTNNNAGVEDNESQNNQENQAEVEDKSTDIVIIGAGGAGLAAALESKDAGKEVIIVEKMPVVGGNTLRATGGLNAAGTSVQKDLGIEDSPELHFEDTLKGGHDKNVPELVKIMTNNGADAVDWLIGLGADLSDVGRLGGASANRAHRPSGGGAVGYNLVKTLSDNAEEKGVEILKETTATEIIYEDDQVKGIKANDKDGNEFTIEAKAVIVTTGGFGANSDMVIEYDESLKGFGTTNHPGATGDGINMATSIGADLIQMEEIQTHPTVVLDKGYMITEAVRGNGAILINRDGKRFVNEIDTRDVVSEATLKQEGKTSFLFFDEGVRESLKAIEKYVDMGLTTEADSIEELANSLDINSDNLKETVEIYNGYVDGKEDKDFSRADMPSKLESPKFYAIEVGPAVHHTMGGLKINEQTQVLNEEGQSINGLYAAGEVVGGVHGGNRLGGNALLDLMVFGRIAGTEAAKNIE